MVEHLGSVFGRALSGLIEICWTDSDSRAINHSRYFDVSDIDGAADFAFEINSRAGCNVYFGQAARNPRSPPFGRAADSDYFATYAVAVDLDDEGAVDAAIEAYKRLHIRPSCIVVTGEKPHMRAQLWWKLENHFTNPAVHTEIQRGLVAVFGGDPTIINPGRVMRLGGSIAWAKKPGRENEMTVFHAVSGAEYPLDRLRAIIRDAEPEQPAKSGAPAGGLGLDAGHVGADIDALIADAAVPGRWHDSVLRLTASLVGKGLPDSAIHAMAGALTQPGWTIDQTHADLAVMVRGARARGYTPEIAAQPEPVTEAERAAIEPALFTPWETLDPALIPRVRFVYGDFYAAGYTSLTVAPPKVGKSLMALAEAVDIACGRGFLTGQERAPQTVVYYNAEDDQNVINARVAAICQAYRIPQDQIAGRLYATSGVERDDFFLIQGDKGIVNERQFIAIEKFCGQCKPDVLIFDPLQDLSRSPETNEVFRLLGQRIRRMASSMGVALGLVHHTRKLQPGATLTIDDARGGGALRGTSRFNRLLVPMSDDEAAKAGVENRHHFFRIGDIETNLAPPSSDRAQWYQKISIDLPNGQSVGVLQKWQWPDAFSGITADDARRVRAFVDAQNPPARYDARAQGWVGYLIAEACGGLNPDDKHDRERIKTMLAGWIAEDVLRRETDHDGRTGRDVQIVVCGANSLTGKDR